MTRTVGRGATNHPRRRLTDQQADRYFGINKLDYLHSVHLELDGSRYWSKKELDKCSERLKRREAQKAETKAQAQSPAPKRKIPTAVSEIAQKRPAPGNANASSAAPPEMPCQHEDFTAHFDDSSDDVGDCP